MSGSGGMDWLRVQVVVAGLCLVGGLGLLGNAALQATADDPAPDTAAPADPSPSASPSASPTPAGRPLAGRLVVIDPGHNRDDARSPQLLRRQVDVGGRKGDCGSVPTVSANGFSESTFTFRTARALRKRLTELGAEVVLTRQADRGAGPCVDVRGRTSGRVGAAALVSLHAETGPPTGTGFQVVSPGRVEGFTERTEQTSALLAAGVRDAMVRHGLTTSTYAGTKGLAVRTDLGVLNLSSSPAVLVEAGNLANAQDAALLTSGRGQELVSQAVTEAVTAFLDRG